MCLTLGIISAVGTIASVASSIADFASGGDNEASPPPAPLPEVVPPPEQPKSQFQKQADSEIARSVVRNRVRQKSAASANESILTGARGVPDDQLNLGGTLLGGRN